MPNFSPFFFVLFSWLILTVLCMGYMYRTHTYTPWILPLNTVLPSLCPLPHQPFPHTSPHHNHLVAWLAALSSCPQTLSCTPTPTPPKTTMTSLISLKTIWLLSFPAPLLQIYCRFKSFSTSQIFQFSCFFPYHIPVSCIIEKVAKEAVKSCKIPVLRDKYH